MILDLRAKNSAYFPRRMTASPFFPFLSFFPFVSNPIKGLEIASRPTEGILEEIG